MHLAEPVGDVMYRLCFHKCWGFRVLATRRSVRVFRRLFAGKEGFSTSRERSCDSGSPVLSETAGASRVRSRA